jgi:uncharacterized membrane protein YtjA (UPF0391 family)
MPANGGLLHDAILFLVAAFLRFGGVAGAAMEGARIIFWVAAAFFIVPASMGFPARR